MRGAVAPSILAVPIALLGGWTAGGPGVAMSAAVGAAVAGLNFWASGTSLAWASTISLRAVRIVALGGSAVRVGIIIAAMFALSTQDWFSPVAFGWAVVAGALLLVAHGARLAFLGVGGSLELPADPDAVRGAEVLAAREASIRAR